MMKHKITHYVQNMWLKHLYTQLYEPTNQNLIKKTQLLRQRIRKRYFKTLETSVINSPISPPSLNNNTCEFIGFVTWKVLPEAAPIQAPFTK